MSITDSSLVDIVSLDSITGKVILTITDHLPWSDDSSHLELLQQKINAYLRFIESREIDEAYPAGRGRAAVIEVATLYPPDDCGLDFLQRAQAIIQAAGIGFRWQTEPPTAHTVQPSNQ